jgi:alkylation response protein AidB-like acyl-CoA dehydrogenase
VTDLRTTALELAPLVRAEADAAEHAVTLTAEVVDALRGTGLLSMLVPRALGGGESDVGTTIDVFEHLSRADGSTGWTLLANATTSAFAGAYCGDDAVRDMFPATGELGVHAGQFSPRGEAKVDGDGYLIAGRYSFGSGSHHASWMGGGALTTRDGEFVATSTGLPEIRAFFVPSDHVTMLGNWDVMGLVATGSEDYEVPEQHVDRAFTFSLLEAEVRRGGPLYELKVLGLTSIGHAAFALGVGRRALDELTAVVAGKARLGAEPIASQQLFLHDLGFHDAAMRAARALVHDVFGEAEATVHAGSPLPLEQLHRLRQTTTYVTRVAVAAVDFAYTWAGTDALRNPSALGRCFRDIHAATQHIFVDNNTLVDAGRDLVP